METTRKGRASNRTMHCAESGGRAEEEDEADGNEEEDATPSGQRT